MRLPSRRATHRVLLAWLAAVLLVAGTARVGQLQTPGSFSSRVAQLSEPGGYFDTDNLISNEKSYLQVAPALRDTALKGGAYIGVGPDQNFSYIAQVRPSIAFIVDLRRDNLLLHLLFKALFELSGTRIEYMSLLFGRTAPASLDGWRQADMDRLTAYIDNQQSSPDDVAAMRVKVDAAIRKSGVPLSASDFQTIDRFHRAFIDAGLPLKFETKGRRPQPYYPTYRDLLFETDAQGRMRNFLAVEDDYQFVRSLQQQDLIVPVVGDLSGPSAIVAIGRLMTERGDRLSAFYASNVEFYLYGDDKFAKFVDNVSRLPRTNRSLIIRAIFAGGLGFVPHALPGYASASVVQPVDDLVKGYAAGRFKTYRELIGLR
jgi:hypothetical protein